MMNNKLKVSLTVLSLTIASKLVAQTIAMKSGGFKSYEKCSIESQIGHIEIGNDYTNHLIERSSHYSSTEEFKNLSTAALYEVSRPFYRWSGTQVDYYVLNSSQELSPFYSNGFRNIINSSKESIELKKRIDQICDNELFDFKILGEFNVELKIGNRVFIDQLSLKRSFSNLDYPSVNGVYIVPGSFESRITKLVYDTGIFTFVINVNEGNESYDAIFEGRFTDVNRFEGEAFTLPERNLLGQFQGTRK